MNHRWNPLVRFCTPWGGTWEDLGDKGSIRQNPLLPEVPGLERRGTQCCHSVLQGALADGLAKVMITTTKQLVTGAKD